MHTESSKACFMIIKVVEPVSCLVLMQVEAILINEWVMEDRLVMMKRDNHNSKEMIKLLKIEIEMATLLSRDKVLELDDSYI
jgi:hypothetical protein